MNSKPQLAPEFERLNVLHTWEAEDEAGTDALGAALHQVLPASVTLALIGPLGAGKTRLVKAFAAACGIERQDVVSPTFVLCQHYRGARTLHHFDAYRLADEDEFLQLGPEECFDDPQAVTVIEWADRVAGCLPPEFLVIAIDDIGQGRRRFRLLPCGAELTAAVQKLADAPSAGEQNSTE